MQKTIDVADEDARSVRFVRWNMREESTSETKMRTRSLPKERESGGLISSTNCAQCSGSRDLEVSDTLPGDKFASGKATWKTNEVGMSDCCMQRVDWLPIGNTLALHSLS